MGQRFIAIYQPFQRFKYATTALFETIYAILMASPCYVSNYIIPTIDIFVMATLAVKNMGTIFRIAFMVLSTCAMGGAFAQQVSSKMLSFPTYHNDELKGPVKKVTVEWGEEHLYRDTLIWHQAFSREMIYNKRGQIIKYVRAAGESSATTTYYYYNAYHKPLKLICYFGMYADSATGTINSLANYEYDQNNRLIFEFEAGGYYEGEASEPLSDTICHTYSYNDKQMTRTTRYYSNFPANSKAIRESIERFDKAGNVIETINSNENKKRYRQYNTIEHEETTDGWQTTIKYYNGNDSLSGIQFHRYNCDSTEIANTYLTATGKVTLQMLTWFIGGNKIIDVCQYDEDGLEKHREYKKYDRYGTEVESTITEMYRAKTTRITQTIIKPLYHNGLLMTQTVLVNGYLRSFYCLEYDQYGNKTLGEWLGPNPSYREKEPMRHSRTVWKYEYY